MEISGNILAIIVTVLINIGAIIYFNGKNKATQEKNTQDIVNIKKEVANVKKEYVSEKHLDLQMQVLTSKIDSIIDTNKERLETQNNIFEKLDKIAEDMHNIPTSCGNYQTK